ncbi:ribonuclease H2 subunit B-like isoform X1 [Argiope bruennichi]|uniref:ribonuclease H2 subunit B-like isoform X1 n=1 Tax=Argiope bruennichi TaxID=94029 RepID=UPI0024944A26|nr:ribonuclease H2 subunit B-like isoform X1 [Argiope bruennichi]XP_055934203.1 ribonuclease H2 subunit B-like isoform X1 [Argiope bruennichi]
MADNVAHRVFLVPENEIEGKFSVIRLKHPKSGTPVLCALDSSNKLYEIVHFMDEFSSWFAGNTVIQDGRLFILTVVDPLFFILSYVNQDGKFCPLEDLLIDADFPDMHFLSKCCSSEELLNIFDSKEAAGYRVLCYNNIKTLHWLQKKVEYLSSSLKQKQISINDGSKAACLQTNDDKENPEILQSYAYHLISDYLSEELSKELLKSLGLQIKEDKPKSENDAQGASKKQNTCTSPTDDYSKKYSMSSAQEKQKTKMSAAQKQLMKVDKKGMKTISSFFQKK